MQWANQARLLPHLPTHHHLLGRVLLRKLGTDTERFGRLPQNSTATLTVHQSPMRLVVSQVSTLVADSACHRTYKLAWQHVKVTKTILVPALLDVHLGLPMAHLRSTHFSRTKSLLNLLLTTRIAVRQLLMIIVFVDFPCNLRHRLPQPRMRLIGYTQMPFKLLTIMDTGRPFSSVWQRTLSYRLIFSRTPHRTRVQVLRRVEMSARDTAQTNWAAISLLFK